MRTSCSFGMEERVIKWAEVVGEGGGGGIGQNKEISRAL